MGSVAWTAGLRLWTAVAWRHQGPAFTSRRPGPSGRIASSPRATPPWLALDQASGPAPDPKSTALIHKRMPSPTNHRLPPGCPRRGTALPRLLPPREGGQAARARARESHEPFLPGDRLVPGTRGWRLLAPARREPRPPGRLSPKAWVRSSDRLPSTFGVRHSTFCGSEAPLTSDLWRLTLRRWRRAGRLDFWPFSGQILENAHADKWWSETGDRS